MNKNSILFPDVNIGERVYQYLKDNGKNQAYLAKKLDMPSCNLARVLKRPSINTKWIHDISVALEYNFFADLCNDSEHVRSGYTFVNDAPGKKILARLKELGMNQTELATELNMSQTNVSRIIKRFSIDSDILISISRILTYNFFREFYVASSKTEDNTPAESFGLLGRYEQLILINDNLKKENIKLRSELYEIRQRLTAAGINF